MSSWTSASPPTGAGSWAAPSVTAADSAALSREFIQNVPEIADRRGVDQIVSLLRTTLVSIILRRQSGLDVPTVVAQIYALRASTPATVSDAGVCLAVLLAPQLRLGTAGVFMGGLAPEKQARFVAALAEATKII